MPDSSPFARTAAVLTCALALGCAGNGEADPPSSQTPPPTPGEVTVESISPRSGRPGTEVNVRARGFRAGESVVIGFGPPRSEYSVMDTARADASGEVTATVAVPSWAEGGEAYLFVVAGPDADPKANSDPFLVTTAEGHVRVTGRVTDEGVECLAVRGLLTDELYTLAGGDTGGLEPGDEVVVDGTMAEMSFCQQGTTLEVSSVERRGG